MPLDSKFAGPGNVFRTYFTSQPCHHGAPPLNVDSLQRNLTASDLSSLNDKSLFNQPVSASDRERERSLASNVMHCSRPAGVRLAEASAFYVVHVLAFPTSLAVHWALASPYAPRRVLTVALLRTEPTQCRGVERMFWIRIRSQLNCRCTPVSHFLLLIAAVCATRRVRTRGIQQARCRPLA